jgi:putative transposase
MITEVRHSHPELSLRYLCRLFGVSRSWLYDRATQPTRAEHDAALRDAIEQLILVFPGYGYRRVTKALQRDGWDVNHKRVLRVMRQESLLCQLKRAFVVTTDSDHPWRPYPNLLRATEVTHLDQVWVADITYIKLPTSFVYLACILDAYSRRCVGWRLSRSIDTTMTLAALDHALKTRQPRAGLIHHSDRGVQYASTAYVARLQQAEVRISMSSRGNPYENAKAESFFKTLKREEVWLKQYRDFREAEANIGLFIEDVYNQKRLHSSLGYVPPAEFERDVIRQEKSPLAALVR